MKYFVLKAAVLVLRIINIPLSLLKVQDKITYISRQSDSVPLDFLVLKDEVVKRKPHYTNVFLTRKISGGNKSVVTYPFHMLLQMYHLATSRFVILDGYCIVASVLHHKSETKVIQIWHASSAIKKFGYQTLDKKSGSDSKMAEILCMHKNYDYVFASSKATAEHFCEGFNVNMDKVKYIGMPHYDTLRRFDNEADMDEEYPQLKTKQNVLYMPTFRKGKSVEIQPLIDNFDFEDYNLIARLHPLDVADKNDKRVIYDNKFTTYDWIKKADIIIADYSSLVVECAWLNKKMFFYLYDYDEYSKDPGLNVDLTKEGLEKIIFKNSRELKSVLKREYDWSQLMDFSTKYMEIEAEDSTRKFVDFIFSSK